MGGGALPGERFCQIRPSCHGNQRLPSLNRCFPCSERTIWRERSPVVVPHLLIPGVALGAANTGVGHREYGRDERPHRANGRRREGPGRQDRVARILCPPGVPPGVT